MIYLKKVVGLEGFSIPEAFNLEGRTSGGEDMDSKRVRQTLL